MAATNPVETRDAPLVTVVIPTRGRPALLRRALDSVLAQTLGDLEIVVVVDGPDPETENMLGAEADPRLQIHLNASSMGGAAARNVGVRHGRGTWIALLDDDDIWLPEKLERQIRHLGARTEDVLSFTRLIARAPHGDYRWPRRAPMLEEPVSEYLFARSSLFAGEAGIQTSTVVVPRALALQHPFDETLTRLQDTDWVLRVVGAGARLDFYPEVLTIWHIEEARSTITSGGHRDWRFLVDWIAARRGLVTPRAYAAFLLVRGGGAAAMDFRGARIVVREAFGHGRPAPIDLLLFLARWMVPQDLRKRLRARWSPGKGSLGA